MQLSLKVSQSLGFLIFPCESPSSDVCHIFILKVILLYFTPQHTDECTKLRISSAKKNKKTVGCGGTYLEPTSRFHGYFMIVVLKRISFLISIILSFCLSQDSWGLKVA